MAGTWKVLRKWQLVSVTLLQPPPRVVIRHWVGDTSRCPFYSVNSTHTLSSLI